MLKSLLYNFTYNQEIDSPKRTNEKSSGNKIGAKYLRSNHTRYSCDSSQPILKDVPRLSGNLKTAYVVSIMPGVYSDHSKCIFMKKPSKPRRLTRLDKNEYSYIAKRGHSFSSKGISSKRSIHQNSSYDLNARDNHVSLITPTQEYPYTSRIVPICLKSKEGPKSFMQSQPLVLQPTYSDPDSEIVAQNSMSPEHISGCAKILRGKMTKMGKKVLRTINTIEQTSSQMVSEDLVGWEFDNSWDIE